MDSRKRENGFHSKTHSIWTPPRTNLTKYIMWLWSNSLPNRLLAEIKFGRNFQERKWIYDYFAINFCYLRGKAKSVKKKLYINYKIYKIKIVWFFDAMNFIHCGALINVNSICFTIFLSPVHYHCIVNHHYLFMVKWKSERYFK